MRSRRDRGEHRSNSDVVLVVLLVLLVLLVPLVPVVLHGINRFEVLLAGVAYCLTACSLLGSPLRAAGRGCRCCVNAEGPNLPRAASDRD